MSETPKAAIIGCGMIADTHLASLRANGAHIAGVWDVNRTAADTFAGKHGIRAYSSLQELLEDNVLLVSICTPSGTHASLAKTVMEAGRHAAVEKPIALSAADCRTILETEKRTGRFCAPISQLRFSETYRSAKAAVDRGDFGQMILGLLSMKYHRSREYYANGWRGTKKMDGGGALMNQGIHGIDMLCGLLGYPVRISGHVATLHHAIEVEDTAAASLVFPNGTLGVIDGSTAVTYAKPRRLELCGTGASITILEDELVLSEGISLSGGTGSGYKSYDNPTGISTVLHTAQYRNILDAALGRDSLYYTAADAAGTIAVICGIYESSATGRTVFLSKEI